MPIPKGVIEAAAEAIYCEVRGIPYVDEDWPVSGTKDKYRQEAKAALEAALPHLREQITQEIRNHPDSDRQGHEDGMATAADIVEGES
jgi:hypothetical protein